MTGDEELDAILATLGGELDDAELDHRTAGFHGALARLREDPAEAARVDALTPGMRDDPLIAALVDDAARGDQVAWDEIVERYAPLVWSICHRYRLSDSDIEEVGQTVWTGLVGQLGNLREPAALPGWLATTTRRECLRTLRENPRFVFMETEPDDQFRPADETAIEQAILSTERNAALTEALAGLPEGDQQLLSLLLAEPPLSYPEISARLGIPVGSIGPRRGRCLNRLRRSYALQVNEPPQPPGGIKSGPRPANPSSPYELISEFFPQDSGE
jgi:RNA polymerase sigma factor (sigma-70 family)